MRWRYAILGGTAAAGAVTAVHDLVQKKHAILRNFPIAAAPHAMTRDSLMRGR